MSALAEIARKVQNGEISAESTVQQALDRIAASQGLNAYLSVLPEFALETARNLDKRRAAAKPIITPDWAKRGYAHLFNETILQADEGCDFDFMRAQGKD